MTISKKKTVLCLSGHDPTGGAGIQADIEAITQNQCHAVTIITALTVQNSQNVKKIIPQTVKNFTAQAEMLLNDLTIDCIKIGLIGDIKLVPAIKKILEHYPQLPVIFDPILAAGGGKNLASQLLIDVITQELLPLTTVLVPNFKEACRLTNLNDVQTCGMNLLEKGCQSVLITGADEITQQVENTFFYENRLYKMWTWERLPHTYHGSGCTLASSLAAFLALGFPLETAVFNAQQFTWNALKLAYKTGHFQLNPNRINASL